MSFLCKVHVWKYVILVFLNLAYFALHDYRQFHLLSYKWHDFILLYGWIILHCLYTTFSLFIHPLAST
jgi:hypothetical protein